MRKPISRCLFKTNPKNVNQHSVTFNELTDGEVLALVHALMIARTVSPVAQDLSAFLRNALTVAVPENDKAAKFLAELEGDMGVSLIRTSELDELRSRG